MTETQETILRSKEVRKRLGDISTTTFWRIRQKCDDFPTSVEVKGTSIKGWHESEVNQWINDNREEVK